MKNYSKVLSVLVLVGGVIISCSKSDPAPSQASLLVGNWKLASYVTTECTTAADNQALQTCTTSCTTLAITATTISITNPGSAAENFTYTVSGATLNLTPPLTDEVVSFGVAGTTLTIFSKRSATASSEANCKFTQTYIKM